jgi:hypothetical protein
MDVSEIVKAFPTVLSRLIFDYYYDFSLYQKEIVNELKCKFSTGRFGNWKSGPQILQEHCNNREYFGVNLKES